jgi:uncharacterized protein YprB with RNaseH-like and TPR domain
LAFDIEASNLSADFGIVLCVGFKEVGSTKGAEILSIRNYPGKDIIAQEKKLLKDVSTRLMDSDVWIAHFGRWYDTVFINTRLLYHNLPVLPPNFPLIDTWRICRNHMKLRNNRLKTLEEFLRLDNTKNAIKPEQWLKALGGHNSSLRYIEEHCRRDVEVLVEAYERIRPLMANHPAKFGSQKSCPTCGSQRLQRRGFHLTRTRRYQRWQCQECGSWTKDSVPQKVSDLR